MPATPSVLLDTLRTPAGNGARQEFDDRYRPALLGFARRVGLTGGDVDEAVQSALDAFVRDLRAGRLEGRDRGMRELLFDVARRHVADASLSAQDALSSPGELEGIWRAEWRRAIVRRALDELYADEHENSHVLQAFELHCLEKHSADEVASDLGMSRSAVFSAKQLLMQRLRERVAELLDEF